MGSWVTPRSRIGKNRATLILSPALALRASTLKSGHDDESNQNNLLSWMMEIATPAERDAASLAHLEVGMSLASIHTSQMNAVHFLYDMIACPEYLKPIQEEIQTAVHEDGPWMAWAKPTFSKLRRLDSFMRKSQRFNPLSIHRVLLQQA